MQHNRTEWKRFKSGARTVDGRVIHPSHEVGDLVLFCPGYPGAGATVFEQRHSERIAGEDFVQVILRHNGTIMNGPHTDTVLNVRQFPNAMPYHHEETVISGNAATIAEWMVEPQTVLEDIGCNYSNIYIFAHSFGSVAALTSLSNLNEAGHPVMNRIRKCICMAPALGTLAGPETENIMRIWQSGYFSDDLVKSRIQFAEGDNLQESLRQAYATLPARIAGISAKIKFIFLHVAKDEYIREKDVRDFCAAAGQNDSFMLDEIDHAIPTHGGMDAHDMPVYMTESLLQLIEPPETLIDIGRIDGKA